MRNFVNYAEILPNYAMGNLLMRNIYVHIARNICCGTVYIIVRVVRYEINIAYKFVHDIL